jgi:hypothetical protein
MIIWRGKGIWVPFIIFLTSLCANMITNAAAGASYWSEHGWPFASALVVSGGLIWGLALMLGKKPPRVLIDAETGEKIEIGDAGELFFLPMKWWGPITSGIGFFVLLAGWKPG